MDNEERNYDNGGWQDPNKTGGLDSATESSQTPSDGNYSDQSQNYDYSNQSQNGNVYSNQSQNGNTYSNQPQNNNAYYNQAQNGNAYYNQPQNSYPSQSGDGFRQSNDGFNRVNNQGYQNYVPEPEEGPGFAIAGMVCGILSIVCCCMYYISGVLGVIGLVFSIIVLKNEKPGKGMAIAGVVCSVIGILIALFFIGYRIFTIMNPEYMNNLRNLYRENLYSQMY